MDTTGGMAILGSPMYMAPEQVRASKHVDARADVWAIGVLLQELLTARPVFHAETITALSAAIVADPPTPLRTLRAEAPAELEAVIMGCLEKDPARRIPDVTDLARALEPFAAARPITRSIAPSGSNPRVVHSSGPPTSKPPDVLGATVFASADASGAATKPSPGAQPPPKSRTPLFVLVAVIALGGAGAAAYWYQTRPHHDVTASVDAATAASDAATLATVSSSVAPIISTPDAGGGRRCRAEKAATLALPGHVHYAYVGGGKTAAIAARATVTDDAGAHEAAFIGRTWAARSSCTRRSTRTSWAPTCASSRSAATLRTSSSGARACARATTLD
jgi:hypothetical protein